MRRVNQGPSLNRLKKSPGTDDDQFVLALRRVHRVLAVAVTVVALLGVAGIAAATTAEEQHFVDLINTARTAAGVAPLEVSPDLVEAARDHAQQMAAAGDLYHNPDLGQVTENYLALGENIGKGGTVVVLHQALMASAPHEANIVNPKFDTLGVGVATSGTTMYVVEVFKDSAAPPPDTTPPFADDDNSIHQQDIIALYELGVTRGCDDNRYCPERTLTRGEMATFLVRAFGLSGGATDQFDDDNGSIHETSIDVLAANGVTVGCDSNSFCPHRGVTRAEMASFLTRILALPDGPGGRFVDTAGSVHAAAIDSLAQSGITVGCRSDRFCPNQMVNRAQMASFLIRALDR